MNEQSLRDKLSQIAQIRGEVFNETWHTFVLERFLARLAQSEHRTSFIFKGGFLLGRYVDLGRETKDLDFLFKQEIFHKEKIEQTLREVTTIDLNDGLVFVFVALGVLKHPHMKIPGFQATLQAQLGRMREPLSLDIGFGDLAEPVEKNIELLKSKGKALFEESVSLVVYSPETIFAEKLQTAVLRGQSNSRMKDYFDLLKLAESGILKNSLLRKTLRATFLHRQTELSALPLNFSTDHSAQLQNYWDIFLRNFKGRPQKPPQNFAEVIAKINTFLIANSILQED